MKWKIGFVAYCFLILWLSSLAPKELPEQTTSVPDYILHLVEYCLLGILAWAAFGGSGFPWGLFAFCVCFGIADECWQDWWSLVVHQRYGTLPWMQLAHLLGCFVQWSFGRDKLIQNFLENLL